MTDTTKCPRCNTNCGSDKNTTTDRCTITTLTAELAELRAKLAEQNRHPGFRCPSCGGSFFGRDVTKDAEGNPQCLPTVQCHDEFGVRCKWRGVWPDDIEQRQREATEFNARQVADFQRRCVEKDSISSQSGEQQK